MEVVGLIGGVPPFAFTPLGFGEPAPLPPASGTALDELEVEGLADQATPGMGETKSSSAPPVARCKSIANRT